MQYESLAPSLKEWLAASIASGCTREVLVQSLRASGWSPKSARRVVELALAHLPAVPAPNVSLAVTTVGAAAATVAVAGASPPTEPGPQDGEPMGEAAARAASSSEILAASPNAMLTADRRVDLLFALHAPRVVLFGGLLAPEECDEIVAQAQPKLSRSTVVNRDTGAFDVHPHRTSRGAHFQRAETPLIERIEQRISDLLGIPVDHGEPIQVLHYLPGAEYKPHFDYFDPTLPGNEHVLKNGGQRVATLIMYLNDVEAGGSTVFPEAGLDVLPRKGNAVFFAYRAPDGQLDARTLHGGSPVAAGEKWIATKWLRERPYVT